MIPDERVRVLLGFAKAQFPDTVFTVACESDAGGDFRHGLLNPCELDLSRPVGDCGLGNAIATLPDRIATAIEVALHDRIGATSDEFYELRECLAQARDALGEFRDIKARLAREDDGC